MGPHANRLVVWAACVGVLLLTPATGLAQSVATDFRGLGLKVGAGDTVYVTDHSGREVSAEVLDISDSHLGVRTSGERRDLGEADVIRIRQRLPDGLWNGALIGLGAGAGLGAGVAVLIECIGAACAGPVVGYAGIGAAVGAGIDALIKGRKVIYERPTPGASAHLIVAPAFSTSAKAIRLTWTF